MLLIGRMYIVTWLLCHWLQSRFGGACHEVVYAAADKVKFDYDGARYERRTTDAMSGCLKSQYISITTFSSLSLFVINQPVFSKLCSLFISLAHCMLLCNIWTFFYTYTIVYVCHFHSVVSIPIPIPIISLIDSPIPLEIPIFIHTSIML